eukprot:Protomagalhaensia_wolfi_Nauph_80__3092@NODE_3163_length_867_cov_61_425121_g2479_i0_p1_GENE_NODE_3163_length_867_cov_61_425121_g2479_i0NODE_3163_length_867_cov_61_425121_g2479_i0_p1_ORF_typecomplete_len236_score63_63IPP2/PF04979_14/6_4e18_NODE_3163_length_867_cov_61_425121_g2479_i0113820
MAVDCRGQDTPQAWGAEVCGHWREMECHDFFGPAVMRPESILKPSKPNAKEPEDDKHIVWDEKVIAEHDLERGTRQRIDEPKTPYVGPAQPPLEDFEEFSLEGPPPLKESLVNQAPKPAEAAPPRMAAPDPPLPPDYDQFALPPSQTFPVKPEKIRPAAKSDLPERLHSQQSAGSHPTAAQDAFMANVAAALQEQVEEDTKKREFLAKRKAHYNEGLLLKQLKDMPDEDDEDEDS